MKQDTHIFNIIGHAAGDSESSVTVTVTARDTVGPEIMLSTSSTGPLVVLRLSKADVRRFTDALVASL